MRTQPKLSVLNSINREHSELHEEDLNKTSEIYVLLFIIVLINVHTNNCTYH